MAASNEQVVELLELLKGQMELLKQQQENNQGAGDNTTTKAKRPDRPVINSGIDDREWALFLDTWSRYKQMIGATDAAIIRMELRAACSPDVNKMLFEFVGPEVLNDCTEEELLAYIKSIAVKQVHHEVHQMNFHMMSQDEGEPITRFVARLKSQAFLCRFSVQCSCDPATTVSYADQMVAQRLIAGLRNVDHQRKVLAEAGTLTTLDAKVKRLQLLETTEESAVILRGSAQDTPSVAAPQRSQYKKNQRTPTPKPKDTTAQDQPSEEACGWCGESSHPGGRPSNSFAPQKTRNVTTATSGATLPKSARNHDLHSQMRVRCKKRIHFPTSQHRRQYRSALQHRMTSERDRRPRIFVSAGIQTETLEITKEGASKKAPHSRQETSAPARGGVRGQIICRFVATGLQN